MIDTVKIAHIQPFLPEQEMIERGFKPIHAKFGRTSYVRDADGINLTWAEIPFKDIARLQAEASLPKLLYGNNIDELDSDSIGDALRELGNYTSEITGLEFDPVTASVMRADFCRNFNLGDETSVRTWNNAIRERSIPRFHTRPFDWNAVYFESYGKKQGRQICCYSKYDDVKKELPITPKASAKLSLEEYKRRENLLARATGIYRVEDRFKDTTRVLRLSKRLGVSPVAGDLLTERISKHVIGDVAQMLALDKPIAMCPRIECLINHFGLEKSRPVIGYLQQREAFGVDFLKRQLAHATFYRFEKQLKESGVLSLGASGTLPALVSENVRNGQ